MILHRIPDLRRHMFALALAALPACAIALPEDDAQDIVSEDYASLEYSLDQGEIIQKGRPDMPTCIAQGSRVICGDEIRLERSEDGSLNKVTATGTPARFEQKPAADQEIVHFSGLTLVFDNAERLLTIDGDAQFSQGGNALTQVQHIEYHLDTRRLNADGGDSGEGGRMVVTPPPANSN